MKGLYVESSPVPRKRLLVLSNGAGEDAIASRILKRLPPEVSAQVVCCPLVGHGSALAAHFELAGPRVLPPSGGLFRESWRLALRDLLQGVVTGHLRQLFWLRRHHSEVALVLAVGDLFPVLWAKWAGLGPVVFVGTAKSVHHHPYSAVERRVLRNSAAISLVRDEPTATELRKYGVAADWLGNAMMDEVEPIGVELRFHPDSQVLTLFPGSRDQAPEVLPFQLQAVLSVRERLKRVEAGIAAAPGTDLVRFLAPSQAEGWVFRAGSESHCLGTLERDGLRVPVLVGCLGDLLARSTVALGQAGTANEQAAGAGVPVVAFDSRTGHGLRWYRKRQKGLLGEAVSVVPHVISDVSQELYMLLTDEAERGRRARIGIERMGPSGGTQRMAEVIAGHWNH